MDVYRDIKKDLQIKKFCLYGFFKNLKFFEPYLYLYLFATGFDLFQIGIFYAIKSGITYIFEVPSAVIADHYGKKNELYLCFSFYIMSFILFFIGSHFIIITLAMLFFGLGEAFRSGTHKAMILSYLEMKNWYEHKAFVYGRTRSFSLMGSSLSAFLSILFVLNLPSMRWIFLVSVVPYILDFILIISYPDNLNEKSGAAKSIKGLFSVGKSQMRSVVKNKNVLKIVWSGASFDGVFKTIKDYIQPILKVIILGAGVGVFYNLSEEASLKIILGLIYGVFYIFSSVASKNVYRMSKKIGAHKLFFYAYDLMGFAFILLAWTINKEFLLGTALIYFVLYLMADARRPIFLEVSSGHMKKEERVTVLSIESQLKAMLMMVFAPLFGWIAEYTSLGILFLLLGVLMIVFNRWVKFSE